MFTLTRNRYFKIMALAVLLPYIPFFIPIFPSSIFGFNLTGWAWILLLFSSILVFFNGRKPSFPFYIWLPWALYIGGYIAVDYSFFGLQLTLQYMVWFFVGTAVSSYTYNLPFLKKIFRWVVWYTFILVFFVIYVRATMAGTFSFGPVTAISLTVPGTLFLAIYYLKNNKKYLFGYFLLVIVPVIQITRMGILMMLALAPLHFGLRSTFKRLFFVFLILLISVAIFYTPSVQKKMFYSGSGSISDIFDYETNPDFNTSGRNTWKIIMEDGLKEQPLFGNGPRSDLELFKEEELNTKEAHNDYLAVRYNYGWIGLILLLVGYFLQFILLFRLKKYFVNTVHRIIFISALTLFIPFFGFMYSDNILKYSHSFGCFHFALIGISFSLAKQIKNEHYRSHSSLQ